MDGAMVEGCLRSNQLLKYLKDRSLPLVVSISEDATRIDGRIQYDAKTNQISGFVLPINSETGMPIPYSFQARNATEILNHFSSGNTVAHFVNVIMARPLANYPPFCLLLFSSDGRYTAEDVIKRWKYIEKELETIGIHVLTISSDSDPRYNSAMRKNSSLGKKSNIFGEVDWFCSGLDIKSKKTFNFQDFIHLVTKLRNFFLKTLGDAAKLPFGDYYIRIDHLQFLLEHFNKDEHELTPSVLDPVDRQNYQSAQRICSDKVIRLLEEHIPGSKGTVSFLLMMRGVSDSFYDPILEPLERVYKIWYVAFVTRIWRRSIVSNKQLTLKNNFLTQNCYSCIEINAHSLIHILLYLKDNNLKSCFLPFLYDSQACESFFRQIRSLTTVFSRVTNCSSKEMVGRINRIQLLNEITHTTDFIYPRIKDTMIFPDFKCFEIPTKDEIFAEITKARAAAIAFAKEVGLLRGGDCNVDLSCKIPIIEIVSTAPKNDPNDVSTTFSDERYTATMSRFVQIARATKLKNYADKFADKQILENSPFVEVYAYGKEKRVIVKKSSLCWLLREDPGKLSSDRIYRVRGISTIKRKKTVKRTVVLKTRKIIVRRKIKQSTGKKMKKPIK